MGGIIRPKSPKMPAPPPPPPTIDDAAELQRQGDAARRRRGAAASILTSPEGAPTGKTSAKTLLGA